MNGLTEIHNFFEGDLSVEVQSTFLLQIFPGKMLRISVYYQNYQDVS